MPKSKVKGLGEKRCAPRPVPPPYVLTLEKLLVAKQRLLEMGIGPQKDWYINPDDGLSYCAEMIGVEKRK